MAHYPTVGKRMALASGLIVFLAVAGCANDSVWTRDDLAQRVAQADTRAEHEAIAEWFEQEASTARAKANDHRRMMDRYVELQQKPTRGVLQMAPYADLEERRPLHAGDFADLCEARVLANEQAADEYLAFARRHRQLAESASD